jgi:hypothetical protein
MKVISGLLPETWGYFCMKNCISTTQNGHSDIHESTHFIVLALLKVHPRFFPPLTRGPPKPMGPGVLPRLTPLSMGLTVATETVSSQIYFTHLSQFIHK